MKLKTLKEVQEENFEAGCDYNMAFEVTRQEAIRWIKVKEEIIKLKEIQWKEYSEFCKEGDTSSDKFYKRMKELEKPIDKEYEKFKELGIKFGCSDYGDDFCLDLDGLINVLTIFFNITKQDLEEIK